MVSRYIILANSSIDFEVPRQLTEINGEPLICRTIRLLKKYGINNILITSHDKRFDNLGAIRYEPKFNDYDPADPKSPWLKAFPIELMDEPTTYLFGDVYYTENAIRTIIKEDNNDILFFCTYNNKCPYYIKHHDEPLAFKVHNFDKFKNHIDILIDMWNKDLTYRRPITWELYRSINGLDVNEHVIKDNCIVINDASCDIDTKDDIIKLTNILGGKDMVKVEVIKEFTLGKFEELKDITRKNRNEEGRLFVGDTFCCDDDMFKYLTGSNAKGDIVVKLIEVIPKENIDVIDTKVESEKIQPLDNEKADDLAKEIVKETKPKKTTKKKTSKK